MSFIINSVTSNSISITNPNSYLSVNGGSGLMYNYRRSSDILYTQTNNVYHYKGFDQPVFVSHRGKEFIFLTSKTGLEYKKYLK